MEASSKTRDSSGGWLTTQEALALLGVSRTRLWQLTRQGLLTPHTRGVDRRRRYFRREDVERVAGDYRTVGGGNTDK